MRRISVILSIVTIATLCGVAFARGFASNSSDVWLSTGEIEAYEKHQYLTPVAFESFWRSHMGIHAQQECTEQTIPLGATGYEPTDCWYESPLGQHSTYGNFFKPTRESVAGIVGTDGQTRIIPLPQSSAYIELSPSIDGGFVMGLHRALDASLSVLEQYEDGVKSYGFMNEPDLLLRDTSGNPWLLSDDMINTGMWQSQNGQFLLVANEQTNELIRINLQTLQLITTTYIEPGDAPDTFATLSITNDGGQVVVNVLGHPPRLIQLGSCEIEERAYVADPVLCGARSLTSALMNLAPDIGALGDFAVFTSVNTIDFYSDVASGGDKFEVFSIYAPGTFTPGTNYLALGDSYASGEGAGSYYAGTDNEANACHLSKVSYPFLLAKQLNLQNVHSVACSGAKIQNIIGPENVDNSLEDESRSNQYDTSFDDPELLSYLPGEKIQLEFLRSESPDITTVSISGNDIGFADFLTECVISLGICYATDQEKAGVINTINDQFDRLVYTYTQARKELNTGGRAYAIGYPEIAKPGGDCGVNVRLNNQEIVLISKLTNYINHIIKQAALQSGIQFINTSDAFNERMLCDIYPTAMNGINLGFFKNLISQESFHPTAHGNQLLAKTISQQTNGLNKQNPRSIRSFSLAPSPNMAVEFELVEDTFWIQQERSYINYLSPNDGILITLGEVLAGEVTSKGLMPNSPFDLELNSEPISLGTYVTDSTGNLSYNFVLPHDVPLGFHKLRMFGNKSDGSRAELRKIVYVGSTENDWDGDGVLNADESCPLTLSSLDNPYQTCAGAGEKAHDNNNTTATDTRTEDAQASVTTAPANTLGATTPNQIITQPSKEQLTRIYPPDEEPNTENKKRREGLLIVLLVIFMVMLSCLYANRKKIYDKSK